MNFNDDNSSVTHRKLVILVSRLVFLMVAILTHPVSILREHILGVESQPLQS
jgi:hypothetical protein